MIYLIESSAIFEHRKLGFILKIGYTSDDRLKSRTLQYKLHNPTCRVISTIPDADEVDEQSLHEYFKEYRFKGYGREWYNYEEDIIKFFRTHKTKESIEALKKVRRASTPSTKIKNRIEEAINEALNYRLSLDLSLVKDTDFKRYKNLLLYDKRISTKEDVWDYFKEKVDSRLTKKNIETYYNNLSSGIDQKRVDKFLEGYNKSDNKLRYICDFKYTSDEERNYLKSKILVTLRLYYDSIGSDRFRALGYNSTKISSEYIDRCCIDHDLIKEKIYSAFEVGKKYTRIVAKEMIADIYKDLGYNTSAKASNIEDYFEVKECKITNKITRKRDRGYLIKGKK